MTRIAVTHVDHGQEAEDATNNANLDILTLGPFPLVLYANVAALPAADATNVNCLAATTSPLELWMSDGTAWRTFGTGHKDLNGARGRLQMATTLLTGLSGATVTWTGAFPAGARAIGVSLRVTTLITGATTFKVGDGTTPDRYAAAVPLTVGTTRTPADSTVDPGGWRAAAGDVALTANGSNFTAGAVRLVALYEELTAPTS